MSLPKTFKCFIAEEPGKEFVLRERELQQPKDGQILVKVIACGVCHSDSFAQSGWGGFPRIPGHEIVGDVAAVPASEKIWKVGDRVGAGWHGGHCHNCGSCRSGDFMTCQNQKINGVFVDGGYGEYVLLRTEAVVPVPRELDPAEAAPLLCAGVTTFNSLRHMNLHPGDVVGIQGIGGLGHLAIQYCRKMGYHTVALSSSSSKKDLAMKLGAHVYLDGSKVNQAEELGKLGGAKVILATAPSADIISALIPGLAVEGSIVLLAVAEGVKFDTTSLITKRLSIRGWPSGTAKDSEDAIKFSQLADVKCMVERYKLEDALKAYDKMMAGKANFRCVLCP